MCPCPYQRCGHTQAPKNGVCARTQISAFMFPSYTTCMEGQVLHKSQHAQEGCKRTWWNEMRHSDTFKQYLFLGNVHLSRSCRNRSVSPGIHICTKTEKLFRHCSPQKSHYFFFLDIKQFLETERIINGHSYALNIYVQDSHLTLAAKQQAHVVCTLDK